MVSRGKGQRRQVFIAVMGVTGAGKSTFIRTASDIDSVHVGHDLRSCTMDVYPYKFDYEDYEITLIDTPGFNDTVRGETEVLRDIADWLDITYRNPPRIKLSGIIYMQALTDRRMYGSTLRNLKMFRQLCGDEPLQNVILTTTGWAVSEKAGEMDKAIANEDQLRTDRDFWQPMIKHGSRMARFEDTRESALEIIMSLVDKEPVVLQIQHELVDEEKHLIDTAAGATVNEEIKKLEEKYKKQLAEMQDDMKEALATKDQKWQEILTDAKSSIERLRDENRRAQDILQYERRNTTRKQENEMENLRHELENQKLAVEREKEASERDKQAMRLEMQMQAQAQRFEDKVQFDEMVAQMRENADKVRQEDRVALEARIREIQEEQKGANKKGRGKRLLMSLVPSIGKVALAALGFPLLGPSPFGGLVTSQMGEAGLSFGGEQAGSSVSGFYPSGYIEDLPDDDLPQYTEYDEGDDGLDDY